MTSLKNILFIISLLPIIIAAKPSSPAFRIYSGNDFIEVNLSGLPTKYSDKNGKFDQAGRIIQLGSLTVYYDQDGRLSKINDINFEYDKKGLIIQLNSVKVNSEKKTFEGKLPKNVKAFNLNPTF